MRATLLVIYTPHLEACRDFYAGFGLPMVREQHGAGPVHYAAELEDGFVFEVYPAGSKEPTGRARLGFSVPAGLFPSGTHRLTDPDGRVVVLTAEPTAAEAEACRLSPTCSELTRRSRSRPMAGEPIPSRSPSPTVTAPSSTTTARSGASASTPTTLRE